MSEHHYVDGVLRRRWDDTTRTFTEWDAAGVQVASRPYTAAENAVLDAALAQVSASSNEVTLRDRARQALTANNAAIGSLETFAAGTATLTNTQRDSYLRQLAQYQARTFKELNALIKLEVRDLATTDGT